MKSLHTEIIISNTTESSLSINHMIYYRIVIFIISHCNLILYILHLLSEYQIIRTESNRNIEVSSSIWILTKHYIGWSTFLISSFIEIIKFNTLRTVKNYIVIESKRMGSARQWKKRFCAQIFHFWIWIWIEVGNVF